MPPLLTATPSADALGVELLLDAGLPGAVLDEFVREDANGRALVRLPSLPSTFQTLTLADYEAALTGLIEYEATVTTGADHVDRVNIDNGDRRTTVNNGAVFTDDVAWDGDTWERFTQSAAAPFSLYRRFVPLASLIPNEAYTASVEVANDGAAPIVLGFDWCDKPGKTFTLAPGERRRIDVTESRAYDNTYRFADLSLNAANGTFLCRAWLIERGSEARPHFDGATLPADAAPSQRVRWTGTAGASTSQLYTPAGSQLRRAASLRMGAPAHTWYLHPAVIPQDGVRCRFVDWNLSRTTASTVSRVMGRAAPVVNRDVLGFRAGTLELYADDDEEVQALEAALGQGETIMIRQNDFPGRDGYFEVESIAPRIRRETAVPGRVQHFVTLTLAEVDRPGGPLLAPTAWTYRDVAATYPSYRDVLRTYETFRGLLLREVDA